MLRFKVRSRIPAQCKVVCLQNHSNTYGAKYNCYQDRFKMKYYMNKTILHKVVI